MNLYWVLCITIVFLDNAAEEGEKIEKAIQDSLVEADKVGISGRDVTPFVLAKLNEITQGKSLAANWALLENNAEIGAEIAVELSKQAKEELGQSYNLGFGSGRIFFII